MPSGIAHWRNGALSTPSVGLPIAMNTMSETVRVAAQAQSVP